MRERLCEGVALPVMSCDREDVVLGVAVALLLIVCEGELEVDAVRLGDIVVLAVCVRVPLYDCVTLGVREGDCD